MLREKHKWHKTTRREYRCSALGLTNSSERRRPATEPEQRGWVKKMHSLFNWQQEETHGFIKAVHYFAKRRVYESL